MLSRLAPPDHLNLNLTETPVPAGPPSPTLSTSSIMSSVSWMAGKTSFELLPLLKNAYSALKDKEKDLILAAELGKSLLEHNMKLKTSYDSLLQLNTPPVTPSCSTLVIEEKININTQDDDHPSMRLIPSRSTREAMMEVLERKNSELNHKLEQALAEKQKMSRNNAKRTRQLEHEIDLLQGNLEIAAAKIQELQEMNQRQKKQEMITQEDDSKDDLIEELYTEKAKMQEETQQVLQSKMELEAKLADTLKDLSDLKQQFEKFDFTQKDFNRLQEAYESQFEHITELNQSLEEHRVVLQKLKDKGIQVNSAKSTPAPSAYGPLDDTESIRSKLQEYQKNTLLQELEMEWFKSNQSSSSLREMPSTTSSSLSFSSHEEVSSEMFHLRDFKEFEVKPMPSYHQAPSISFESVLSKATGIDQELLDETLNFINRIELEHHKEKCTALYNTDHLDLDLFSLHGSEYPSVNIYPDPLSNIIVEFQQALIETNDQPKTFTEKIKQHLKRLFNYIWRWCRFAIILTTALLISASKGPDSLMLTY